MKIICSEEERDLLLDCVSTSECCPYTTTQKHKFGVLAGCDTNCRPCFGKNTQFVMDAKKPPAETEGAKEINHLDCTINLEKVEPLLAFPLVELGPECKKCQCLLVQISSAAKYH